MFRRPSWRNMCIPLQTGDIIKEETFILHLIQQPAENNDFTTAFDYYRPASWKTAGFSPLLPVLPNRFTVGIYYLIFIFSWASTLLFLPSSIWTRWPSSSRGPPLLLVVFPMIEFWTSDSVANDVLSKAKSHLVSLSWIQYQIYGIAFEWSLCICLDKGHLFCPSGARAPSPVQLFVVSSMFLVFFSFLTGIFFHLTWSEALKTDVLCPDGKARWDNSHFGLYWWDRLDPTKEAQETVSSNSCCCCWTDAASCGGPGLPWRFSNHFLHRSHTYTRIQNTHPWTCERLC